jgi:N-acetyl-alpha-D-glucosaminyl L-malate synthase BshA
MKIGITCYPTFGGSGVVATEIGLELARRDHQVHFICYDIPRRLKEFTDNVFFHEVEVREYALFEFQPYALSLASKMVEVSTYENLDLLHVHYAVPHATSAYLAKQILGPKSPKIITTLHGTDITLVGQDRSYLPITRFSIVESDAVTAPSQFLKRATYDKLNVPTSTPIEVIPNFVDTDLFCPKSASTPNPLKTIIKKCPIESGTKLLLHVSNFRPVKKIPDLIKAFAIIGKEVQSHLVLIGDGPERSTCEALARELGISDKVCFLGKMDSFVPWLQSADLFMLPSELESFGLAALEAMSCGVPVIATNAQGIPEVVIDGETGLLSEIGGYQSMAENAIKVLKDPALHKRFGKAARDRALNNFRREPVVDQYIELYKKVLNK